MTDPFAVATAVLFANQAAASLGRETGKGVWAGLERLEGLVRRRLNSEPRGKAALERVQAEPQDEAAVRALADIVDSRFVSDDAFRRDVVELLTQSRRDGSAGDFVALVLGDAEVGKITQINIVRGNVSF